MLSSFRLSKTLSLSLMWLVINTERSMFWRLLEIWKGFRLLERCIFSRGKSWKKLVERICRVLLKYLSIRRLILRWDLRFNLWQGLYFCSTALPMNFLVTLKLVISLINFTTNSIQPSSLKINTVHSNSLEPSSKPTISTAKRSSIQLKKRINSNLRTLTIQTTTLLSYLKIRSKKLNVKNVFCWWRLWDRKISTMKSTSLWLKLPNRTDFWKRKLLWQGISTNIPWLFMRFMRDLKDLCSFPSTRKINNALLYT